MTSQKDGGSGGPDGGRSRQEIWKLSRTREYSQSSSSQAHPAGIARTGRAKHSEYLITMNTVPRTPDTPRTILGSHGSVVASGPHFERSSKIDSPTKISSPQGPRA